MNNGDGVNGGKREASGQSLIIEDSSVAVVAERYIARHRFARRTGSSRAHVFFSSPRPPNSVVHTQHESSLYNTSPS